MAAYARQSGEENAPPIQIQAQPRLRRIFGFRLTPARWFLITSLCILILGMTVIGWWIAWQIERNVVERSAFATALYVDSLLLPPLQELATSKHISPATIRQLETLLTETSLGMEIASFKVWDAQGRVMYSTNPTLIDRIFPISSGLQAALRGNVHAELSDLEEAEHVVERQHADRLLEIYSPVRAHGSGDVLAVVEYYHRVDDLEATIRSAQQQGWLVIIAVTSLMYLALSGFVYRASRTIVRQDGELRKQVRHLTDLIAQNRDLHERVQRAAARSTAHHERYLRRIGADLHDGPAQYLGAALLHVDRISMISETSAPSSPGISTAYAVCWIMPCKKCAKSQPASVSHRSKRSHSMRLSAE
ncbi:MAG: hypothetical protein HC822_08490 [Oscillochloris sp.]|nr:hypothetical protein [Oscillochloris sp.]